MPGTVERRLLVGYASHRGQVREGNEDNFCVVVPPAVAPEIDGFLAVADGMGGHQAGEVASGYVVDKLAELFSSQAYRQMVEYSPQHGDYYVAVLKEILEQINDGLTNLAAGQAALQGMGTTATVALLFGGRVFVGHVGDSRLYLLRAGEFRQVTQDHSWVEEQVRSGAMSQEEAKKHSRKNVLTRSLGNGFGVRVDRLTLPVQQGDLLLLCTDGLTNVVDDGEIAAVIKAQEDPQAACDALVELANRRGGPDNITVVIARLAAGTGGATKTGGRVVGRQQTKEQAAITQKIVLRPAAVRRQEARAKSPLALALIAASFLLGGAMVAVVLLLLSPQFRDAPLFLVASAAIVGALCGAILFLIAERILRR